MIHFFENPSNIVYAVQSVDSLSQEDISKLNWLFGSAKKLEQQTINRYFVGPRAAMITPWSTNVVEITHNMGIKGLIRIEEFHPVSEDFEDYDPMIDRKSVV